jgi:uroporphyrinogen-III synthase
LKTEGIAFNEIEVYQTTLAPLKYQIRKIWWNNVLVHLQLKAFDKQQNQKWNLFCRCYHCKTLELKKIKNLIAEIPTIEDVIVEVIEYYNTEESIEPSAKI